MSIMRQSNIEQTVSRANFDLGSFFSDTVDFFTDDIMDYAGPILGTVGGVLGGPLGASLGGALGSAIGGSNAVSNASDAMAGSAQQAADTNWKMYAQSRQDNLPFLRGGYIGLSRLTGMTPEQLANPNAPLSGGGSQPQQTYDNYLTDFNANNSGASTGQTSLPGQETTQGQAGQPTPSGGQTQPLSREEWQAQQPQGGTQGSGNALIDGPSEQDFKDSPYYNLGMEEQQRAISRHQNSLGQLSAGGTGLDLQRGANLNVKQNYGDFVNSWIATKLNPAQSLAGLGQTSGMGLGQQGIDTGGYMGSAQMNAGNARASGQIGQSNVVNQGLQGVGDYLAGSGAGQQIGNWFGGLFGGGGTQATNANQFNNTANFDPQWDPSWGLG